MSSADARVAELEQRLAREVGTLERLVELATQLNAAVELDVLLGLIIDAAEELLDAELASLLLLDDETDELVFRVSADVAALRLPATEGIAGWVVQHREPVVVEDAATDERFSRRVSVESGVETRSLLAVPLLAKGGCVGVVEVLNKRGGRAFGSEDVATAQALAALAAVAVENATLYERLRKELSDARTARSP